MIKVNVYNQEAKQTGEMEVSAKIFGAKVNPALVHQAVVAQMSNERQVLAHTKDRSEVRGGGKKPWKQKGTGRARSGSSRSPIWIGGGVTFGPTKERNFSKKINLKMKQKALAMAISDRLATQSLVVIDEFKVAEFKTKIFNAIIDKIEKNIFPVPEKAVRRSVLVIYEAKNDVLKYSGRNLSGVKMLNLNNLNIVDLLKYRQLVVTKAVAEKLSARK